MPSDRNQPPPTPAESGPALPEPLATRSIVSRKPYSPRALTDNSGRLAGHHFDDARDRLTDPQHRLRAAQHCDAFDVAGHQVLGSLLTGLWHAKTGRRRATNGEFIDNSPPCGNLSVQRVAKSTVAIALARRRAATSPSHPGQTVRARPSGSHALHGRGYPPPWSTPRHSGAFAPHRSCRACHRACGADRNSASRPAGD